MNQTDVIKQKPAIRTNMQQEMLRDEKAWRALAGIWRGKKILDPVQWQKNRREWTRTLP